MSTPPCGCWVRERARAGRRHRPVPATRRAPAGAGDRHRWDLRAPGHRRDRGCVPDRRAHALGRRRRRRVALAVRRAPRRGEPGRVGPGAERRHGRGQPVQRVARRRRHPSAVEPRRLGRADVDRRDPRAAARGLPHRVPADGASARRAADRRADPARRGGRRSLGVPEARVAPLPGDLGGDGGGRGGDRSGRPDRRGQGRGRRMLAGGAATAIARIAAGRPVARRRRRRHDRRTSRRAQPDRRCPRDGGLPARAAAVLVRRALQSCGGDG